MLHNYTGNGHLFLQQCPSGLFWVRLHNFVTASSCLSVCPTICLIGTAHLPQYLWRLFKIHENLKRKTSTWRPKYIFDNISLNSS